MIDAFEMFDNRPNYFITINNASAPFLNNHIMSIQLTENRGFDADMLQIQVDDSAGNIMLPDRNAEIQLQIGFGMNLVDKGKFIVDAVAHSGPPDVITIGAHSADFKKEFVERKSDLYEALTLDQLVQKIASKYGYDYAVADKLKSIEIKAKQQADESDANLLTRLAEEYDAVATIKMGKLLFLERGTGKTASGQQMPVITHNRSDGDQHSYSVNDRSQYTGVEARYLLPGKAKRKIVKIGEDGRRHRLRTIFESEEAAIIAAEKELQRIKRNSASISVKFARGKPELSAESPLKLIGYKSEIEALNWIVTTATHTLDASNGLTTQLQAEVMHVEEKQE